jgi:ATP-dependent protease Clp ATPase subunit
MWFRTLKCSFCRRSDKDVAKLVAGASGDICDRCAHEAVRIMETTSPGKTEPSRGADGLATRAADWNRTWHFSSATD